MTQPATGLASAHDSTLIILDMQTRPAAAMPSSDSASVRLAVVQALRAAEILAVPVIYTEHDATSLGATDPHITGAVPQSAFRVRKGNYNAWADDEFANAVEIAGRRQVAICGLQAHISVVQTAISMVQAGYQVFVVADGICSHDPLLTANAIERMRASAISVTTCESLLHEWLAGSDADSCARVLAVLQEN